jgi:hypothetical protein
MRIDSNLETFRAAIQRELAKRLIAAATYLQTELKKDLSVAGPVPSKPGEYPHAQTYQGRNAVVITPSTIAAVSKTMTIRIGYLRLAWYMGHLEENLRRLGLLHKYRSILPELISIIRGGK